MEFAIYYVPQKSDFYEKGSHVLGYDIREQKAVPFDPSVQESWVENIKRFGFHMTITDAVQIEESQVTDLLASFKAIVGCFAGQGPFKTSFESTPVAFWENNQTQAALRYQTTTPLAILHTALVVHLQSQGKGSHYFRILQSKNIPPSWGEDKIKKTQLFFSPYIFDEFKPHFSLINPYAGDGKEKIIADLTALFSSQSTLEIGSLCFVTRKSPEDNFTILEEVTL